MWYIINKNRTSGFYNKENPMPKKYNSQATIENVLTVSAKLFLEKGFDKTSIQDIAEAAGISKGLFIITLSQKMKLSEQSLKTRQKLLSPCLKAGCLKQTHLQEKNN